MKSLKSGKSRGADLLRSEAVRSAPESIISGLQENISKVISQKELPEVAELGILITVKKPDKDPTLPDNYNAPTFYRENQCSNNLE